MQLNNKTQELSPTARPSFAIRALVTLSNGTLYVECKLIASLMFLLTFLILLNVVTRYSGASLYWVDESAVYSVVWLAFIGGSAMTRLRMDFAVELLTENISAAHKKIAKVVAGLGVLAFSLALVWMCLIWFDPLGYWQAGFDAKAFAGKSFNFIYTEKTQTLNWPTWVMYLIIPIFSLTMVIHSAANLVEELGWAEISRFPEINLNNAESIN